MTLISGMQPRSKYSRAAIYAIFIWHGFFLALTKSMLDLNTIFPALVTNLTDSKTLFGVLYAIMLGVPFIFNIFFGHFLNSRRHKKPFLLLGIYLRSTAFLGMAAFTYFFATDSPGMVLASLFFWVFMFSFSGGFAGLSYADIIGKLVPKGKRGNLYATKQFTSSLAILLGGIAVARIFSMDAMRFPNNYSLALAIGFGGLIVASGAFWFIREPPSPAESNRESFRDFLVKVPDVIRRDPAVLRFIIVENLASFSLMILPFYLVFAKDVFGIQESYVGKYLLYQIVGAIGSNIIWGVLSHKRDSKTVVRACILLGGLIPIFALTVQPLGPDIFARIFVLVGFVMSGRRVGFEPYLLDLAPEDQRTIYLGISGTLNFSKVLLPVIGGVLIDSVGFQVTFILVTLSMLLAFYLMSKRPKRFQS